MTKTTLKVEAGAGGKEANDTAALLMTMYQNYFDKRGIEYRLYPDHAEIGILRALFKLKGDHNYLQSESGIHGVTRISPFDIQARRHTSFIKVSVNDHLQWQDAPQVRMYILYPYKLVRGYDGTEIEDVFSVLDGNLDAFICSDS